MQAGDVELRALPGIPHISEGDDLANVALASMQSTGDHFRPGDILVFAQKIVSKSEGRTVDLAAITPSAKALELAAKTAKDPRLVECVLRESTEVLRYSPGVLIVAHRLGFVLANAGIDRSNVDGDDRALLLPIDPDASAALIRKRIRAATGLDLGILIIDSIGRAWRLGTVGTTIGASGLPALLDWRGQPDLYRRPLETTETGFADEIAAAASLVMGQSDEGKPIALVRGFAYKPSEQTARDLLRPKDKDLFR